MRMEFFKKYLSLVKLTSYAIHQELLNKGYKVSQPSITNLANRETAKGMNLGILYGLFEISGLTEKQFMDLIRDTCRPKNVKKN